MKKSLFLLLLSVLLVSCSSSDRVKKEDDTVEESVSTIYNDALNQLGKGNYKLAVERFEEVERTYPYSRWAIKSQIMAAYTSYRDEEYDNAILILDRYIKLHPGNKDIPYAYYLKALCFYEQISNVDKDQGYTELAKSSLKEIIARFPNSQYSKDAVIKIDLVNDHLAGKEVEVGRFYLENGNYIGAINRFQVVLDKYDTTSHVLEALYRLVETNLLLGLRGEAVKYASVLGYNFPDSRWYKKAYHLIEGKNEKEQSESESEGKWYNFKGWKGLTFDKIRIFSKDEIEANQENSDNIIEKIDYRDIKGYEKRPLEGVDLDVEIELPEPVVK